MQIHSDRAQQLLDRFDVDVLIATSAENIFYATGYKPFQGVWNRFPKAALIFRGNTHRGLALPMNEVGFVADWSGEPDVETVFFGKNNFADPVSPLNEEETWLVDKVAGAKPNAIEAIAHLTSRYAPTDARIVIDQSSAPELTEAIAVRLPQAEVSGRGEELWRLMRMVKTEREIGLLVRAIEVNEAGIHAVHSRLGTESERGLAATFYAAVGAAGGNVQHWIGSFGRRAGAYRLATDHAIVRRGRFRFDCGIEFGGYCSDLGGTAQVGETPSADEKSVYDALSAGVETALETGKPGVRSSELYAKVTEAVRKAGLRDYEHSLVGHGIGVEPRDYPILGQPMKAGSQYLGDVFDPELEAGMVLNIECPMIRLSDGGFQHEVTLVVKPDGPRLLSEFRQYRVIW